MSFFALFGLAVTVSSQRLQLSSLARSFGAGNEDENEEMKFVFWQCSQSSVSAPDVFFLVFVVCVAFGRLLISW